MPSTSATCTKAGYEANPLEDGSLDGYSVLPVPMEELTKHAVEDTGLKGRARAPVEELLRPRAARLDVQPARSSRR